MLGRTAGKSARYAGELVVSEPPVVVVVVTSSPHQSSKCGVWRVEKVRKFWLPIMSECNPAAKRQLPFGSQDS